MSSRDIAEFEDNTPSILADYTSPPPSVAQVNSLRYYDVTSSREIPIPQGSTGAAGSWFGADTLDYTSGVSESRCTEESPSRMRTTSESSSADSDGQLVDPDELPQKRSKATRDAFELAQSEAIKTRKRKRGRNSKTYSSLNPSELERVDGGIIRVCGETSNFAQINLAQSLSQRQTFSLKFPTTVAKMIRPGYTKDGYRGSIVDMSGNNPLQILVTSHITRISQQDVVVIVGLVRESDNYVQSQPHFTSQPITNDCSGEILMDGIPCSCIHQNITPGKPFNLDFGIIRNENEPNSKKLIRDCRIVARVCFIERMEHGWIVMDHAQLVTETMTCGQPQGLPVIEKLTRNKFGFMEGGMCVARGKNLLSKTTPPNITVQFQDFMGEWKENAAVYHDFTTKDRLCFDVPHCPLSPQNGYSVDVEILIVVDGNHADKPMEFTYLRPREFNEYGFRIEGLLPIPPVQQVPHTDYIPSDDLPAYYSSAPPTFLNQESQSLAQLNNQQILDDGQHILPNGQWIMPNNQQIQPCSSLWIPLVSPEKLAGQYDRALNQQEFEQTTPEDPTDFELTLMQLCIS